MKTKRKRTHYLSATLITIIGFGCASPETGSGMYIENEKITETELRLSAMRNESSIRLVVHRIGPRMPGFIRDPEIDSPYEADLIVYNRHGFPFLTSSNDGNSVDPDLGPLSMVPTTVFDHQQQLDDLQLTLDVAEQLRGSPNMGERFRWELRSLQYMASAALENANNILEHRVIPSSTPSVREIQSEAIGPIVPHSDSERGSDENVWAYMAPYTHQAAVRWANCCWSFGQHSAVLLDIYDAVGTYVGAVSTRNHGREASDPSMLVASNCPKSWSGRNVAFPAFQPFVNTDTFSTGDAGGCGTSYGLGSGQHVCNDDSLAQYWNIKYNTAATWVTCGDSYLRTNAPSCD